MNKCIAIIATLLVTYSCSLGSNVEHSTLPYRALVQLAQLDMTEMTGITNQIVKLAVASTNPDVAASDIKIWINAKSGVIPVDIDASGAFSLPMVTELWEENPNVIANQPRGTMKLHGSVLVEGSMPESRTETTEGMMRYSEIFFAEAPKRRLLAALGDLPPEGDIAASANPLVMSLHAKVHADKASITILSKNGDIEVPPVAAGHFKMIYDNALYEEDPWVRIGTDHEWTIHVDE